MSTDRIVVFCVHRPFNDIRQWRHKEVIKHKKKFHKCFVLIKISHSHSKSLFLHCTFWKIFWTFVLDMGSCRVLVLAKSFYSFFYVCEYLYVFSVNVSVCVVHSKRYDSVHRVIIQRRLNDILSYHKNRFFLKLNAAND